MISKNPKPAYRRYIKNTAKVLFVAEAIGFVATYGFWYRLNQNRDARLYMYKNYNWALESYYQVGELLATDKTIRNTDLLIWKQEGKI